MPCNCLAESLEKEPRTVTETSMGYWIETLTSRKQSPGVTAHCAQQLADRTRQQCSLLGERGCTKEATSYRGNGHQSGLSVIRETTSWGRGHARRQLLIKPYNKEDWIAM